MALLDPMVERCSTIKRLAIYPKAGSQVCLDLPASFGSQAFHHLRVLSGSAALVAPDVLEVIGTMPQLEHLAIHALNQFLPALDNNLSPASFPALKRLLFGTWYLGDMRELAQLQPLLCRLEGLELQVDMFVISEELGSDEDINDAIQETLAIWLEKTICLRKLSVNLDPEGNNYELIDLSHPSTFLKLITEHQIEFLYLNGTRLDTNQFQLLEFNWSHLKELRLPQQSIALKEIHIFASLPSLRHLQAQLYLLDDADWPDKIWGSCMFRTLE
ncbi:hypothetical protein FRC07_007241, partial [Ceratobasidium sp. 392]